MKDTRTEASQDRLKSKETTGEIMSLPVDFYDKRRSETYVHELLESDPTDHGHYQKLKQFISVHRLQDKKCLEIGSGRGLFQDLVQDYTGTDIAESLAVYYNKTYKVCRGGKYDFENDSFDVIWSIGVFEHILELQEAMCEIRRLMRQGGYLYFAPAWQCRPWAANGYAVRPYSDFDWKGKLIKASIPIRNSVLWRSGFIFLKRIYYHLCFLFGRRNERLVYRKIRPNWEHYWTSDSDACNSIDPHDAILWFQSNGFKCLSHPMHLKAFFVRTGTLIFRKINK